MTADAEEGGGEPRGRGSKIPEEDLLTELRRLADERGEPVTSAEMREHGAHSAWVYLRRFGSWPAALDAAGLEVGVRKNVPDEELLDELRRLAEKCGGAVSVQDMTEHGEFSKEPYYNRFGSWTDALDAAGLESGRRHNIPDEELLDELRRLAEEFGEPVTGREMDEHGEFSDVPYYDRFGSWPAALDAAGLEGGQRRNVPDEELLDELRRLAEKCGGAVSVQDMDEHGEFSHQPYYDRWGSWNEALDAAGLEGGQRRNVPDEELLAELRRLADERREPVAAKDMTDHGKFGVGTYRNRFGSWTEALAAADTDDEDTEDTEGDRAP